MTPARLLAIKIGNTNLAFGLYDARAEKNSFSEKLAHSWRAETRVEKTADEYAALLLTHLESAEIPPASICVIAIVSVVPPLTEIMRELAVNYFNVEPFIAGAGVKSGIQIKYDDPRALGADRLVALVGAKTKYGTPCIVIDLGTATTFNALDARGAFIGGAIAPGLNMSAQALHEFTAKLPRIEIAAPSNALAKNTRDALRSGIFFGYVGLVDGMIARFKQEMNEANARVIATGGMSALLAPYCPAIEIVDINLSLDGLRMLYEMNA